MHDALGNALVIEMRDLLAQDEVFEQRGTAQAGLEGILVVRDRHALVRRERTITGIRTHAIERTVRRVEPGGWRARANLCRRIGLGESTAGGRRIARRDMRARLRPARRVAVLPGLGRIFWHRGSELADRRHFPGRGVRRVEAFRFRRRPAHGRARRGSGGFRRLRRANGRWLARGHVAHVPARGFLLRHAQCLG